MKIKITETILRLSQGVLDLIFPINCLVCGTDAAPSGRASPEGRGAFLCAACQAKLTKLPKQLCLVCQKPAAFGKTHDHCLTKNVVDGSLSYLSYNDPNVKKIIGAFKYKFIESLNEQLANLAAQVLKAQNLEDYFKDFVLLPIPLHLRRRRWRGFNQAEKLGEQLALILNLKLDLELANRIKNTKPQTQLTREQRRQNIEGAFNASQNCPDKYLLVDDIVTSGSTVNELAKLLKKQGAQEVWALTVAHG